MKSNDRQQGRPQIIFDNTKATIESYTGLEGAIGYAHDFHSGSFGFQMSNNYWRWLEHSIPYTQTVVVDIGGKGDFTSVKSACDYVATQTRAAQDEWVIFVRPGFYNESPFTIPTYTYVIGDTGIPAGSSGYGWSAYVYTTTMTTGAFITLTAGSSIQNMYVYVAVGTATGDTQCDAVSGGTRLCWKHSY